MRGKKEGLKDAHDYLQKGLTKEYSNARWNSRVWTPSNIVLANSLRDSVVNRETEKFVPYPWEEANKILFGMHFPDVILINAPPKSGKSLITGELENWLQEHVDEPIADLSIEDTPDRRAETLVSLRLRRPLHFPDVREKTSNEVIGNTFDELLGDNQIYFYENFGVKNADEILQKIDYFVGILGCRYVIFDHLNFVASYHDTDERKALDWFSNELAQKAVNMNFCLILVAHQNRAGQVMGSSNPEKVAWVTLRMFRDPEHENKAARNIVRCTVKYNRRYGRTGDFFLEYREGDFGLHPIEEEVALELLGESTGGVADDEEPDVAVFDNTTSGEALQDMADEFKDMEISVDSTR